MSLSLYSRARSPPYCCTVPLDPRLTGFFFFNFFSETFLVSSDYWLCSTLYIIYILCFTICVKLQCLVLFVIVPVFYVYVIVQFSCFLIIVNNCQNSTFLTGVKALYTIIIQFNLANFYITCFKELNVECMWLIVTRNRCCCGR